MQANIEALGVSVIDTTLVNKNTASKQNQIDADTLAELLVTLGG